jgi:hypothetical protein
MKFHLMVFVCFVIGLLDGIEAQTKTSAPPLPNVNGTIKFIQAINFGSFTLNPSTSSGGTVTIDYATGSRASGGDVILIPSDAGQRGIYYYYLCPGRQVTVTYDNTIPLAGNNGGSMSLVITTTLGANGSTFVSAKGCDEPTIIGVGGTLTVGNTTSNPAGSYSGTFQLTFAHQ